MANSFENTGPATSINGDVGGDVISIQGVEAKHVSLHLPSLFSNPENLLEAVKKVVLTSNATGHLISAGVKSLGETIQSQLEKDNRRLNYVIFNMNQSYSKSFNGFVEYTEHRIYGILFGVWIFESGQFENTGFGSFENWRFGGYKGGNWVRSGEPIKLSTNPNNPSDHEYGAEGRLVTFSKIE